jgi:hypothetical protein
MAEEEAIPKVNINQLRATTVKKLEDLEGEYLDAVNEDEDFFDFGEADYAVYGNRLAFKAATIIKLKPVDDLLAELETIKFILPDRPAEMDTANIERWKTHVFDDSRLDTFEAQMKKVYSSFDTPDAFSFNDENLGQAIQTAFYDYHYDRDKQEVIEEVDNLAAAWAAEGFLRAPGAFGHEAADMANKFDSSRKDKTENVFGDLARVVQQNIKWSIENGQKIESLHMDFAIKYSELSKVFIQSAVDSYVAEIDKRIDEQQASVLKINKLTKAMELDSRADIKKNELELKERTARLLAYTSATNDYIDSEAGLITEELRLATNIQEGYGGVFASYGSLFTGVSYEE